MTEKEKKITMESDYIEVAKTKYSEWQSDLDQLEDKVSSAGSNFEQEYNEQIAILKRYLHDLEEQIANLETTDSGHWEEQRIKVEESAHKYHDAYDETLKFMDASERQSAGWLEGFTDRPPSGSAGWLEGFHTHAQGSEGWVEGMAKRTPKSKGWVEGYGNNN